MKIHCLLFVLFSICFLSCKKENKVIFNGDGFIYTDGNPAVAQGGIGWYFAESRVGQWEALPLHETQLPAEFKNITVEDSIPVIISLLKTKTPVSCDCVPGCLLLLQYYFDQEQITSIYRLV